MAGEQWLEVILQRSGGQLPTLRPTFRIDVARLSAGDKQMLDRLLNAARFLDLPAQISKAGHPDSFAYELTVHGAAHSNTVLFHDQDGHTPALDELVQWIREHQTL